ncbi:serine/threonine-protein phosphatase 7 long form homolog isoform X2 [Elaeis guineensis]|uniref:serine/threonine-protein phosphatase 7 long form homolog isoform X2 n=1 Tax=Elaeis guineensis var. tenera TaxID=51953 RepID=UPI003C6D84E6
MDPGPIDDSILYGQATHRSSAIWDGQESGFLTCRRRLRALHRSTSLDIRIVPYLRQAGFYGLSRVGFIQLDWHLITAFVERWRPETHTFHLPYGECTITLEDICIQLGLPVDGLPVIGSTQHNWQQVCLELLGVAPPPDKLKGSRLSMVWLEEQFNELSPDADDIVIQRYARAYILQLMGGCLFADKSNNLMHIMFLPLLEDLDSAGHYSWGSAGLAWLYRELCRASRKDTHDIAGPLILLQVWAWDRFPYIAPRRLGQPILDPIMDVVDGGVLPRGSLAMRWRDALSVAEVSTHVLMMYRYHLDRQKSEQVIWQPYTPEILAELPDYCFNGQDVWRSRVPLLCFHIVEWHYADRVLRQFGIRQPIPIDCDTDVRLHHVDLRGRVDQDWSITHQHFIQLWESRQDQVIDGASVDGTMDFHDPYMQWYRRITRRFICRTD